MRSLSGCKGLDQCRDDLEGATGGVDSLEGIEKSRSSAFARQMEARDLKMQIFHDHIERKFRYTCPGDSGRHDSRCISLSKLVRGLNGRTSNCAMRDKDALSGSR